MRLMRYEARITAYDCLDQVVVALVLSAHDDLPQPRQYQVLSIATSVRGDGETDPREWLRDALVGCLEAL
jgi:hypothetical protein